MRSLIIICVRHTVTGCCKDNATDLKRLSCDDEWLVGDVCLSNECQSYEKYNLCLVQHIKVVIDWFSTVLWGAIKVSNSPTGGANDLSCPPESRDEEVCCARAMNGVSINRC